MPFQHSGDKSRLTATLNHSRHTHARTVTYDGEMRYKQSELVINDEILRPKQSGWSLRLINGWYQQ